MSFENPLWGAPKIHGELLKLGIEVAQSTVSIYMVPRRDRPLQTWKTFLCNHMEGIASIDLFVVPKLFAFLVLSHRRRQLVWIAVTRNPTAEWLARQITEAFPWDSAPKYLVHDNDRAFGAAFKARVRAMGIRDRPTSFRSPWQNGYVVGVPDGGRAAARRPSQARPGAPLARARRTTQIAKSVPYARRVAAGKLGQPVNDNHADRYSGRREPDQKVSTLHR
jgi:hypothetical protein